MWMRTGLGVGDLSRFLRADFDLERLREFTERDTDGPFDFLESALRRSLSFDVCLSLEPFRRIHVSHMYL